MVSYGGMPVYENGVCACALVIAALFYVGFALMDGDLGDGLPNTLSVSFPGWEAEALVLALAEMGIAVGTGSACTTGDTRPSHVLQAMGVSPGEARGALRFSLGRGNSAEEIDATLKRYLSEKSEADESESPEDSEAESPDDTEAAEKESAK